MSDHAIVDNMERVWRSIDALCTPLTPQEWQTPTDCPGWTVQDQIAHLVGGESRLLGLPAPEHTPRDTRHVKNDMGARNEVWVDWYRSWPGLRVLARFRELTDERLRHLRAMQAEDFQAPTQTPIGPGSMRDLLHIRIFDAWIHEQDIRRALQRPGHLEGPVAVHSVGRVAMAMPYVVGRKVKPANGTTVVLEVTGVAGRTLAIRMDEGRARTLEQIPPEPTVRLRMDAETFTCLGCGRRNPQEALAQGQLQYIGDEALGRVLAEQMNIMI